MISILFSLLMSLSAFADDAIPAGCTASPNFSTDAYKVWMSDGAKQSAGEDSTQSKTILVGKRTEIQLILKGTESRGFVNFEIPLVGTYVIATDAYPRMDLTDFSTGEVLNPISFGKIHDCGTVNKALRFQFTKAGKYNLSFISSQSPVLNILIWRVN